MSQAITLQLPDEVMKQVTKAANSTGLSIEATLQMWISQTAKTVDEIAMLQQANELPIYTPQGGDATAQALLAYGQQLKNKRNSL